MQLEKANEKLIDLKTLCELLQIKGIASAKKWCAKAKIKVLTIGNKNLVHKFLVDIELDKPLINDLKNNYPSKWIELYKCYKENDHLAYISLLEENAKLDETSVSNKIESTISVRIKPLSNRAKRLANS